MSNYKLAIFDMDGTILDTLTDIYNAVNHSLKTFNMPLRTKEEVRMFVGNGLRKLAMRAVPAGTDNDTLEKFYDELINYYGKHSAETTAPYDGINTTLKALRNKGIATAVVSNKADFAVQSLAKEFFDGLFDYAIGEHNGFAPKPAPDMVNEILSRSSFSREDAVYIGDSDVDLLTACNSKMDCIAVSWGFRSREFLQEHGANVIISEPKELLSLICP